MKVFIVIFSLFFISCTNPKPLTKSAVFLFKTKKIRVNDTAFINVKGDEITIDVYSGGANSFSLVLSSMICIDNLCLSSDEFTYRYLNEYYPDDILKNIITKKRLSFKNSKITKLPNGFKQVAKSQNYNIVYIVTTNMVLFRDRLNGIIIKLKENIR